MNPENTAQPVTMFLKPSFLMTAHGNGLQVSVSVQLPRPNVRN